MGARGLVSQARMAKPPSRGAAVAALPPLCWWHGGTGTAPVISKRPRTLVLVVPSPLLNSGRAQGTQVMGLPFLHHPCECLTLPPSLTLCFSR